MSLKLLLSPLDHMTTNIIPFFFFFLRWISVLPFFRAIFLVLLISPPVLGLIREQLSLTLFDQNNLASS